MLPLSKVVFARVQCTFAPLFFFFVAFIVVAKSPHVVAHEAMAPAK